MSLEKEVLKKLQQLPPEQQKEVLDFADFLSSKKPPQKSPPKSLRGLWKGVNITPEDVAEARKEMWGKYSKD